MNKKYRQFRAGKLETAAFVSGFVLMVYELAGARMLAPYVGSSTYVWTSVIGVIIAALSIGYYLGGRIADARGYVIDIARICLGIALTVAFTLVSYVDVLTWVVDSFNDARVQGVIASLILFAPTSVLLGILSPYLVKMNVTSLKTSGRSVESLSALNSVGGIVGTFMAGFVLFGFMGSRETMLLVSVAMLVLSWMFTPSVQWRARAVVSVAVITLLLGSLGSQQVTRIDTPSANFTIMEYINDEGRLVRGLATGPNAAQSGVYANNSPGLAFWYTRQIDAIVQQQPAKQSLLILGGGAFTMTQRFAQQYPDATIDTVEIDQKLADIARKYFQYDDPANAHLIFEDARTFVNTTQKTYDIVIVDVYGDTHVPFSLMTSEYGDRIAAITKPGGVVVVNMIAASQGGCYQQLRALDAPYRARFSDVRYSAQSPGSRYGNYVVTYSNVAQNWMGGIPLSLPATGAYTDNYAPAERLQQGCDSERTT